MSCRKLVEKTGRSADLGGGRAGNKQERKRDEKKGKVEGWERLFISSSSSPSSQDGRKTCRVFTLPLRHSARSLLPPIPFRLRQMTQKDGNIAFLPPEATKTLTI